MEWKSSSVEDKIGINFKNSELLFLCLIHPSYAQQINEPEKDNERLEYLGETILRLVITDYLYQNCPYLAVSKLSALRDKLEEGERLTTLWFNLGLGETFPFLALKDERYRLKIKRNNPFEKALKALVGALEIDRGYSQTYNWLNKQLIAPLLERHLKKNQERVFPEKQLKFLGDALYKAIVTDYLYRLLPYINPPRLTKVYKTLVSSEKESDYISKITSEDWQIINNQNPKIPNNSFSCILGAMYLYFSQENSKTSFKKTGEWWIKNCVDEEEVWHDAIAIFLKDGIPQKWIIRQVMGYESKDYNEGRERFHELMDLSSKNEG
ncbi:ribonuclease III [Rippkaea orientalis PCC 8801]|uniref:Ribonuclease III n=1 Tax=Rippkaea orientalis (strain PCC 8801 / RF-1) TaxID=41431 RepID=B7JXH5_RIPO1|nr:ribonuclease III domain-containing protein [Rippkaea orientalis]ACK64732.1 ribonuclease III [Rippkaea orientalis PCC 8801]